MKLFNYQQQHPVWPKSKLNYENEEKFLFHYLIYAQINLATSNRRSTQQHHYDFIVTNIFAFMRTTDVQIQRHDKRKM
ncbi:CLUMA_CG018595, isoform A [Clunio marinus]|uniref:CLUMA_CG018595, isoform A n=1 Tax=Clunio marinus TaxID=568069 RepID=A0A1J1IYN5_9DIPT|nr:CLUMA_CG018595, isoform A [Clunio marinus]